MTALSFEPSIRSNMQFYKVMPSVSFCTKKTDSLQYCQSFFKQCSSVNHGENKLSTRQQADIMAILAKYGSTDGLTFDHYETDWDFD